MYSSVLPWARNEKNPAIRQIQNAINEGRPVQRGTCRPIDLREGIGQVVIFVKISGGAKTVGRTEGTKNITVCHHGRGGIHRPEAISSKNHVRSCHPSASRTRRAARSINCSMYGAANIKHIP